MLKQLQEDIKQAMRNKEKNRLSTLRMFVNRIQNEVKDKKRDLTNEEIITIGRKFVKEINEEFNAFYKVQNGEKMAELLESENVITSYLPKQMSREEIENIVKGTIEFLNGNAVTVNIGNVMKLVSPMVKGKADGSLVKDIVTELIK